MRITTVRLDDGFVNNKQKQLYLCISPIYSITLKALKEVIKREILNKWLIQKSLLPRKKHSI